LSRTPGAHGSALRDGFRQAKIYSDKKGFAFGGILHFTPQINGIKLLMDGLPTPAHFQFCLGYCCSELSDKLGFLEAKITGV
jgi:hypothetical protein